jgi:hypothetical protein
MLQAGMAAGTLAFLGRLPAVAAHEAKLSPERMQLTDDMAPLVRLLEETPREKLLEEVASRIKQGTSFQQIVTAVMLAGVRSIQPRPVGFKFHAVLVVHSAYQASLHAPDRDRWLPLFWALDNFKVSQARNAQEGNWKLGPLPTAKAPAPTEAKQRFLTAMDAWDEEGADAALCAWSETAGAHELFEVLVRYAARDQRDIGHKIIYLANGWRTLEAIGWRHSLPILRSLVYAFLDRGRDPNPAQNDLPTDRPWKEHPRRIARFPADWVQGKNGGEKSVATLLQLLRQTEQAAACDAIAQEVENGIGAETVWQALLTRAAELTVQQPGIIGLHSVTSANALHFAYRRTADDSTRRMLLLQAVAFVAMFRERMGGPKLNEAVTVGKLEPLTPGSTGPAALEEIFAEVHTRRLDAIRKTITLLHSGGLAPDLFLRRGRQMIYLKGTDSHDYKLSEAVWEDGHHVAPSFRPYFLAASLSNLKGSTDKDNQLVQRTRAALGT